MKKVVQIAAVLVGAMSLAVLAYAQTNTSAAAKEAAGGKGCPALESVNDPAPAQPKPAGCCQAMASSGGGCCQAQGTGGGCCQSMTHASAPADLAKFNAELDKLVADMNKASKDKKIEAMTAVINKLVEERKTALNAPHTMSMSMSADGKSGAMCPSCAHCPMMSGTSVKTAPAAKGK